MLDSEFAELVEHRVVRFIGWAFLVLSAAIVFQSGSSLVAGTGAEESLARILLAVVSVTFMPLIAVLKPRIAAKGNLQSIAIEAKETFACSALSFTLLVGLVASAALGRWWLDAVTAPFASAVAGQGRMGGHPRRDLPRWRLAAMFLPVLLLRSPRLPARGLHCLIEVTCALRILATCPPHLAPCAVAADTGQSNFRDRPYPANMLMSKVMSP